MKQTKLGGLMGLLCVVALSSVGCTDWQKKYQDLEVQYADLTAKHNQCIQDRSDLQTRVSQVESDKTALTNQLGEKTTELSDAQSEIARLKAGTGSPPPVPTPPGAGRPVQLYTVASDILFPAGGATLTDAGKRALDAVVSDLQTNYTGMTIRVFGHTDSDPIKKTAKLWQDNLDLSANRAMAVTRYVRAKGINPALIETVAMGETKPLASNATKDGKAKNRRVEIAVVR